MGLFTLKVENGNLASAILEKAKSDTIDYEKDFENWLENSPNVLFDDDEMNSVIWIGRQTSALVGESDKYPDLIGIDSAGDLVVVELKKGKTPREVVAQVLEYASWGATLDYEALDEIAQAYYRQKDPQFEKNLLQVFQEAFSPDAEEEVNVEFNRGQKLFIVAEEITPTIRQVASYLRTNCHVDIYCLEFEVLKSKQGEFFISTEKIVGLENVSKTKPGVKSVAKWNEAVRVKDIVPVAVSTYLNDNSASTFKPTDIIKALKITYPNINRESVRCQIMQDCVNHPSRKHYPSGQTDRYFRIDTGIYRRYDPLNDGKWNFKGEKIEG
jgi:hypothetical protein